ncbi:CBS domain-containing protein [Steroidobacter agaridevorans]|uniref:CBS domain-containing protein n=1 Tax=Steroidobacter agaridevorans TaxID=2695856 RepID=A0A829Y819_9GAMM|nr:CBS domain-containing protein [Steroidobacter agaridevorans]GFE79414.1 CBS domain-containing protein [Steroidobacter agaridevorans]GFE88419.1 CBS domain-containing protein [Steroidobacter agaridevorans]
MNVSEHCCRGVISIADTADIVTAARVMRDQHVGLLAVYRQDDDSHRLTGVLTDRDIVMQVTAADRNPHTVRVQEVMTRQPILAYEHDELRDVLQVMRLAGIRRVPVVDASGAAVGIIALDDAIELITGLLCDISGSIRSERHHEWRAHA